MGSTDKSLHACLFKKPPVVSVVIVGKVYNAVVMK